MFSAKLKKQNGKLVHCDNKEKLKFELFIQKLKEGEELEVFISVQGTKATQAQISKVHTCIRIIAMELGYSFEDMKLLVKSQAGLCTNSETETYVKSFADCSMDEISMAIEACNEIAQEHNIILE
jgi:hypothetical protein